LAKKTEIKWLCNLTNR